MKRYLFAAVAAAGLMTAATAASAQTTTGIVNITGTVAAKCTVIDGGSPPSGATFGTTVALGELADTDGTLKPSLVNAAVDATAVSANFRLNCTGANNAVTIDANPLVSATAAPAGYANTVHFTGRVSMATVGGTNPFVLTNLTTAAAASSGSLGANTRLANAAGNINIQAYAFNTPSATDLLVAATDYAGSVTVTITPGDLIQDGAARLARRATHFPFA